MNRCGFKAIFNILITEALHSKAVVTFILEFCMGQTAKYPSAALNAIYVGLHSGTVFTILS